MKTTVILVPVFNEEENIDQFCKQILRINLTDNSQIEVLFIDDGSEDKTWDLIKKNNHKNEIFNGLKLVKNFGKDTSIKVGLNYIKDKTRTENITKYEIDSVEYKRIKEIRLNKIKEFCHEQY